MLRLLARRTEKTANAAPSEVARRYREKPPFPELSYGTVRDYCDSADFFPQLARHQNDLKDVERPWAVKAILNRVPPGGRLLEIGSGEPLAAATLAGLGYDVTVCDPFDGSGNGPTEYAAYQSQYTQLYFVRSRFTPEVARNLLGGFDCIFSISVLEHVVGPSLEQVFEAAALALKPNGYSIHVVDHVLEGKGDTWHTEQNLAVLRQQYRLAGNPVAENDSLATFHQLLNSARNDLETFLLAPQGHNLWRGGQAYDAFPFRKCIAIQTIVRRTASAA